MICILLLGSSVDDRLESNVKSLDWHQQSQFQVVADWERNEVGKLRSVGLVRQKGELIDFSNAISQLDNPSSRGNLTERFVNDGKWTFSRTTPVGRPKLTGGRSQKLPATTSHQREGSYYGFQLDGYFPGNESKTLCEILKECKSLTESKEVFSSIECVCLKGNTEYGEIMVGLDPNRGYALVFGEITKDSNDRYSDERFNEHRDTNSLVKWVGRVVVEEIQNIDNHYVAVKGYYEAESYTGSDVRKGRVNLARSEFDFSPDFNGTDAFRMDFDNGARIADFDHRESMIGYIWMDGKMQAEGAGGVPIRPGKVDFSASGSAKSRVIWTVTGCIFLMMVFLVVRRIRNGQTENN